MAKSSEMAISPVAFLAELGKSLKSQDGVDVALAEIVSEHLLVSAPADDCVDEALKAIVVLASKRASPPKEDSDG